VTQEHRFPDFKPKKKSKHVMVEYFDEETNQIVKYLREKVKKKKITALKRAVMLKRDRLRLERTKIQNQKEKNQQKRHDSSDSDFVTESEDDGQEEELKEIEMPYKPAYPKYKNIFTDLDAVFKDVECMILKTTNSSARESSVFPLEGEVKLQKGKIREYVDIAYKNDLEKIKVEDLVAKLVLQLKLLYFKRKMKQT
jgi:hypothetical protein